MRVKTWYGIMLCLIAPMVIAGEVDGILAKHWQAQGGEKALKAIKTIKIKGTITVPGPQGQMDLPINMIVKDQKKIRFDASFQGMSFVQCFDGDKGWKINPMLGSSDPEDMTEDELKDMKKQAHIWGELFEYKDRGIKVELKGKVDIEGTETFHLIATDGDDEKTSYYIDTENYILIKSSGNTMQNGAKVHTNTFFSDYKEVGNLMMAHSLTIKGEGGPQPGMEMRFEVIELNPEISDDDFARPKPIATAKTP